MTLSEYDSSGSSSESSRGGRRFGGGGRDGGLISLENFYSRMQMDWNKGTGDRLPPLAPRRQVRKENNMGNINDVYHSLGKCMGLEVHKGSQKREKTQMTLLKENTDYFDEPKKNSTVKLPALKRRPIAWEVGLSVKKNKGKLPPIPRIGKEK